jgi:hypothetical protein
MALPSIALPTKKVKVAGQTIEIRALSRSEAMRLAEFQKDPDEGETFIVSCACGVSMDEAREWRQNSPAKDVGTVVDSILVLSGLVAEDGTDSPKA